HAACWLSRLGKGHLAGKHAALVKSSCKSIWNKLPLRVVPHKLLLTHNRVRWLNFALVDCGAVEPLKSKPGVSDIKVNAMFPGHIGKRKPAVGVCDRLRPQFRLIELDSVG